MHVITWVEEGANYKVSTPRLKEALEVIEDLRNDNVKFTHIFEE